jgi:hypothetical protein
MSAVVLGSASKLVMEWILESKKVTIFQEFIHGLRGRTSNRAGMNAADCCAGSRECLDRYSGHQMSVLHCPANAEAP